MRQGEAVQLTLSIRRGPGAARPGSPPGRGNRRTQSGAAPSSNGRATMHQTAVADALRIPGTGIVHPLGAIRNFADHCQTEGRNPPGRLRLLADITKPASKALREMRRLRIVQSVESRGRTFVLAIMRTYFWKYLTYNR